MRNAARMRTAELGINHEATKITEIRKPSFAKATAGRKDWFGLSYTKEAKQAKIRRTGWLSNHGLHGDHRWRMNYQEKNWFVVLQEIAD